ncbi:hypothetical protein [uncultured Flavobacterium sp.]|uniref:hypothetical protein n=1 Tax=uncultured Flavobacterium sp. TaxID=165435 RepID=UPI0025D25C61|nr:hypothetical protein [uncultured Flavobacterium sp.]
MLKKHLLIFGFAISLLLLVVATMNYPGGSQLDKASIGYSWKNNYISNLFEEKAVNGLPNDARFWAIGGMFFLSMSCSLFFVEFSKRIPKKGASNVIRYFGIAGMVFTFLIATPLHDLMVTLSSTVFLLSLFYVTVFIFKSKRHLFKLLCTVYLIAFYGTLYIYGSGNLREYLPVIQKMLFAMTIGLILGLHYFTKAEDFKDIK